MIESINDILKSIYDIEHSRHRSPVNALVNRLLVCALIHSWKDYQIFFIIKTQNSR